jgi:hypothetical protein
MIAATAADDLYTELAPRLGGERSKAKIALISAMYGGTAGDAAQLVQLMKDRFPAAFDRVESAARIGEKGGLVRTWPDRARPERALVAGAQLRGRHEVHHRARSLHPELHRAGHRRRMGAGAPGAPASSAP